MHSYVATRVDRIKVTALLAVIATALFVLFGFGLETAGVRLPYWLSSPGVLAFFTGVFVLYDRVLWKRRILGRPMSPLPDLSGHWEGHVTIEAGQRRREEEPDRIPCRVQVEQTWSRMLITFETAFTRSDSLSATIVGPREAFSGLRYEYRVRPKPDSHYVEPMAEHSGLARIEPYGNDWTDLRGDFFNDRNYFRFGEYSMHRVPSKPDKPPWERPAAT